MTTIREAILDYLKTHGQDISGLDLITYVKGRLDRPHIFDGSILRAMRRMKEHGEISCEIEDQNKSLYRISVSQPKEEGMLF